MKPLKYDLIVCGSNAPVTLRVYNCSIPSVYGRSVYWSNVMPKIKSDLSHKSWVITEVLESYLVKRDIDNEAA